MPTIAIQLLALAIQEGPQIVQWFSLAQAANDLTDEQLQMLLDSEHKAVADFAAAVQAAKAGN